jgi:hypothetical protein
MAISKLSKKQYWPFKLRPDLYLGKYPTGPHAQLARELMAEEVAIYQSQLEAAIVPSRESFLTLLALFGLSAFSDDLDDSEERDRLNLHTPLKAWLRKALPSPPLFAWSAAYALLKRARTLEQRKIVQQHGLHPSWFGEFGAPTKPPIRPRFWKVRLDPKQYLWRYGLDNQNTQNVHLARAAVVPFEQRMSVEFDRAEATLRDKLTPLGAAAELAYQQALEKAYLHIVWSRYGGIQSMEHFRALNERCESAKLTPQETGEV